MITDQSASVKYKHNTLGGYHRYSQIKEYFDLLNICKYLYKNII